MIRAALDLGLPLLQRQLFAGGDQRAAVRLLQAGRAAGAGAADAEQYEPGRPRMWRRRRRTTQAAPDLLVARHRRPGVHLPSRSQLAEGPGWH